MPETTSSLIRNAGRLAGGNEASTGHIANLPFGAQLGLGNHLRDIDAVTPLTLGPVQPIVIHSPTMFKYFTGFDKMYKALIERHAKEISGVDIEVTLESFSTPIGHDGQQLNVPTHSRRAQVTPSYVWNDVLGNPVFNFHLNWIKMIRHPDTQASLVGALEIGNLDPQLISSFTGDVLYIQYDSTMLPENIIDGYIIAAQWPQTTSLAGYKRTIGEVSGVDRTIAYHGLLQHSPNTKSFAKNIANILGMHRVNYDRSTNIASAIASRLTDMGVQEEVTKSISEFTEV